MNKKDDIPYGINYIKYKDSEYPIHTISFGGRKVLVSDMITHKGDIALGFFINKTENASLEMIFHNTDDIDFIIHRLKMMKKKLRKTGK